LASETEGAMSILGEQEYSAEAHGVGDPEVVIEVHGDVNLTSAPGLANLISEIVRWAPERLVIDLSDVDTFGAGGIKVLVAARRDLVSTCDLVVRSPNPLTRQALEVTGIDQFCRIED
jgi:anti-anti-sigma factor